MALSYALAPIPKWYIADLTGKPLGGGSMYTYQNLDKTTFKYIYQDVAGSVPWTNPVLFAENGSQGPFYWQVNSSDPTDTYYIEVYDANGVLQWTIDNFIPSGSGGSIVTTALDLENLLVNNVMWRNIGASANPVGVTFLKIAPGAHAGLAQTSSNAGPDTCFIKNNTAATDQLQFLKFTLGNAPLTGDITPVDYLNYSCTNTPAGETKKVVQYPITRSVQNLTNQNVTVTIWARCNSGNTSLTLQWLQFFGDGSGASPSVISSIQTLTLPSSWKQFPVQATIPSVSGKVLGGCGNDALFLQVQYPLGVSTNIDFTKPCVYLGNIPPTEQYQTYDMIDGVINAPRTGYVTQGFDSSAPPGYVIMNDGTIGTVASLATTRANIDTFPLYNLIYTNVIDPWAPVSGGRSGDPVADFTANKTLTLTRMLGRALASSGAGAGLTVRDLGSYAGEETHVLTISEMPSHFHSIPQSFGSSNAAAGSGVNAATAGSENTGSTGSGAAHNTMQPTSFMNFFIKL